MLYMLMCVQNVLFNTNGTNDNMQIQVYFIFDSLEILNFLIFITQSLSEFIYSFFFLNLLKWNI